MEWERPAAVLGVGFAVLVLIVGATPYLLGSPQAVSAYYTHTAVGPPVVGLFAVIGAVVLIAGLRGRSDPATVAGIAVVVGGFAALIAWWWALATEPALAGGVGQTRAMQDHRWVFALVASLQAIANLGYGVAVLR